MVTAAPSRNIDRTNETGSLSSLNRSDRRSKRCNLFGSDRLQPITVHPWCETHGCGWDGANQTVANEPAAENNQTPDPGCWLERRSIRHTTEPPHTITAAITKLATNKTPATTSSWPSTVSPLRALKLRDRGTSERGRGFASVSTATGNAIARTLATLIHPRLPAFTCRPALNASIRSRSNRSHGNIALPFSQIATPPAHDPAYNEPQQLAATDTRIPTARTRIRWIAKKLAQRIRRDTGRDRLLP